MQQVVVHGELKDIIDEPMKCQAAVRMKDVMNLLMQQLDIVFAFGGVGDVVQIDHVLKLSVLLCVFSGLRTQQLSDSVASSFRESLGKLSVESIRLLALFDFDQ